MSAFRRVCPRLEEQAPLWPERVPWQKRPPAHSQQENGDLSPTTWGAEPCQHHEVLTDPPNTSEDCSPAASKAPMPGPGTP